MRGGLAGPCGLEAVSSKHVKAACLRRKPSRGRQSRASGLKKRTGLVLSLFVRPHGESTGANGVLISLHSPATAGSSPCASTHASSTAWYSSLPSSLAPMLPRPTQNSMPIQSFPTHYHQLSSELFIMDSIILYYSYFIHMYLPTPSKLWIPCWEENQSTYRQHPAQYLNTIGTQKQLVEFFWMPNMCKA